MTTKVCIGCDREKGDGHESWCPVITGTLSSLPRKNEKEAD